MEHLTAIASMIDEIRTLHSSAQSNARMAVRDAIAAGKLLLDLKGRLPRGQFLPYLKKNLGVSIRQCQRYMAAAEGKSQLSLPDLIPKCDTMSYYPEGEIFLPIPGRVYMLPNNSGDDILALVECAKGYPDYFFVTVYGDAGSIASKSTERPLESILVHVCLEEFGLQAPTKQKWKWKKSAGVMEAEETLYGPSDSPPERVIPKNAPRPINLKTGEIDWDYPYRGIILPPEFEAARNARS